MKISIKDTHSLSSIQEIFNSRFPSLKLEFFDFKPGEQMVFSKQNMIGNTNQTIGQIRKRQTKEPISMNGNQKVITFEANFFKNTGIHIQVFRRSGKNWIETSSSDNLTLSRLNNMGKLAVPAGGSETLPDFDLYHEQS